MSGRCISCNATLDDKDMVRKLPTLDPDQPRVYAELCHHCYTQVVDDLYDRFDDTLMENQDDFYQTRRMPKLSEDW